MPRPKKCRRVCALPGARRFGPLAGAPDADAVRMAVDEYEAIRLIDLEGLTQEQCAARIGVSRATVQAMYDAARRKLAEALVDGRELAVEGGHYELCPRAAACPKRRGCAGCPKTEEEQA